MSQEQIDLIVAIRRELVLHGRTTIAELSRATHHSFPTIKRQIESMIAEGEVIEKGFLSSSGGRPAKRYEYNAHFRYGLALYIEKTIIRYRVFDCSGNIIESGESIILSEDHLDTLGTVLEEQIKRTPNIAAISVGAAAAIVDGHIILAPDYPTLIDVDLQHWVESRTHRPAIIENDMNAAVYGFGHTYADVEEKSIVYIYLGKNGPGAGILVNGRLIRGKSGFSGEISFIPFASETTLNDRITYGRLGPSELSDQELDALSRLVTIFAVTLNPHMVVFSDVDLMDSELKRIDEECRGHISHIHVPSLVLGTWEEDYFAGLTRLGVALILESI